MVTTRPPRVWSDCTSCGKPTQSVVSICRACKESDPVRPTRACVNCGVKHRSTTFDTCPGCRRPRDGLTGGRWITVAGVRRWQPWTDDERAERIERLPEALAEWRRQRVRALLREQYGESGWWHRHGALFDDAPGEQTKERVQAMADDFHQFENRPGEEVA